MRSFGRVTPKAWILSAHSSRHHARKRAEARLAAPVRRQQEEVVETRREAHRALLRPRVADGLAAVQEQVDALGVGDLAGLGSPMRLSSEAKSSISPRSRGSSHAWQRSVANPSGSVRSSRARRPPTPRRGARAAPPRPPRAPPTACCRPPRPRGSRRLPTRRRARRGCVDLWRHIGPARFGVGPGGRPGAAASRCAASCRRCAGGASPSSSGALSCWASDTRVP